MRTLDRYVLRSFLYSYLLCLLVMLGMRIVSDLFINMDEFAKMGAKSGLAWSGLLGRVASYYACNSLTYFQEMSGVILVTAAAFSLARMNHTNELTAVLASGVSMHRVILPVIIAALGLSLLGAVDQELLVPRFKNELVRDRAELPDTKTPEVRLINDGGRNVWYSRKWLPAERRMLRPLVLVRDEQFGLLAKVSAEEATYVGQRSWRMDDALVAVTGGAGATTAFVPTQQTPAVLTGAAALPQPDLGVQELISAESASLDLHMLIRPSFQVLAARLVAGSLDTPRTVATVTAETALYGRPADGRQFEKLGYYAVGATDLAEQDVADWKALCRKLSLEGGAAADTPAKRVWQRLTPAIRVEVQAVAVGDRPEPADGAKADLVESLNQAVQNNNVFRPQDFPDVMISDTAKALLRPPWRTADAAQQTWLSAFNRLALDRAFGQAIIKSQGRLLLDSDLTGEELALRQNSGWMDYMSTSELSRLLRTGKAPDATAINLIKHVRFTAPFANLIMLLVGLPFILSRERNIKASATLCLMMVGVFYVFMFFCRYLGGYGLSSVVAAWLPILVFGPIAALMLDSVKT